jgi:ADP-ribosylglycohydrolase
MRTLLKWELEQRQQSGYDTQQVVELLELAGGLAVAPISAVEHAHDQLDQLNRLEDWPFEEPDDLQSIRVSAQWPEPSPGVETDAAYRAAVLRGWSGRVAGNMLGKPVEGLTREAIRAALEGAGAWPLTDYFPPQTAAPAALASYIECWPETTKGLIDGSSRDDDVDYTILNLHVLERHGLAMTTADVGSYWLQLLPYLQTFTAERVAIRNLLHGDHPDVAALHRNPYREFIGAAIRADAFGFVNPGDPGAAASMAYQDAVLSHRANGTYSAMWCAALVASAFTAGSAQEALTVSLSVVPRRSRLHRAISEVIEWHQAGLSWDETLDRISEAWQGYNWVHALVNAAVLTAGIVYGDGDFDRTIILTVLGGLDTDSNGATAGSVAGILARRIEPRWTEPLNDTVRSAVFGYDGISLSGLADRTAAVAEWLRGGSKPAIPEASGPYAGQW